MGGFLIKKICKVTTTEPKMEDKTYTPMPPGSRKHSMALSTYLPLSTPAQSTPGGQPSPLILEGLAPPTTLFGFRASDIERWAR